MSIFVNANKNLALTLAKVMEFIVAAIFNSIQQLGCIFVMSTHKHSLAAAN